ncbi:MAG: benzoate-CoA ligase family protein [Acidobacteria bacterium]|nr:benzoate-CoA ligase family protein [Acidobacteriota bacterium]
MNRKPCLTYNRRLMNHESPFNLLDYFFSAERLKEHGAQVAIEFQGRNYSYQDLRDEVERWANGLRRQGIKTGERVALLLYDSPDFIAGFLATMALGAICVPINTFLNPDEIAFILKDSGAAVLLVERDLADKLNQPSSDNAAENTLSVFVLDEWRQSLHRDKESATKAEKEVLSSVLTDRDTPAFILYTSGSTGTPKGALHRQGNVEATVEGFGKAVLQLTAADKIFSASRLYFAYGLGNSLSFPLAAAATVILQSGRPTPQSIAGILREQKPTVFFAVPAVYRALLDLQEKESSVDTTSLRLCVSAGEALPAALFAEWKTVFGLTILDGIGSTEMLHMFISNRQGEARAGSSGKVVAGYAARILDDAGSAVALGEQGNLWVKGASAMCGYWQREDLTSAVVRDGWMKTGDVYRIDAEGYYFHIGRSDDCFKVKGLWVSPIEIEAVLLTHPEVTDAAVVASRDENGLATAKAFLVIRNNRESLKTELYEFAKARLPLYKTPTQYEWVSEMPRTSTGKVQRFKLRVRQ